MTDLRTMHPQEMVRGLMRGHRPDLHLGWDATGAVEAALRMHPNLGREDLMEYAEGFADGMHRRPRYDDMFTAPAKYKLGYGHGTEEDRDVIYPAAVNR